MPDLNEILKDKKNYPDTMEIQLGAATMTIGQLRAHEEATGVSLQQQLENEKSVLAQERDKLARAQAEVVELWTKVQADKDRIPAPVANPSMPNWREDPFFVPLAKDYSALETQIKAMNDQYANVQKAIAGAVKYVADRFIENDYRQLPEDFRKETPLEKAVRDAQEKKYFDSGGLPALGRVYEEWSRPRSEERIRKEAYDKARVDIEREAAQSKVVSMKPGFVGQVTPASKPQAKDFSEALSAAFQDPEIVAGLAGR